VNLHRVFHSKNEKMKIKILNKVIVFIGMAIVIGGSTVASGAPWNVTILHPAGAIESQGLGTTGTQQAGLVTELVSGATYATLWSGSAGSLVNLNPTGASASRAFGISGTQQVGHAFIGITQRAGLWQGTAASWVDLHPTGAISSTAYATTGTVQVGGAFFPTGVTSRAGMWTGSAGSWV
jgi:hypothetical protein